MNWRIYLAFFWLAAAPAGAVQPARALYEEGLEALNTRHFYQAEKAFLRCVALDSTFYDAYVALARMYMGKNALGEAETLLQKAMRQAPGRIEAPFEYSKVLSRQGRDREVYELLQQVIERAPRTAAAHMGLGYLLMQPRLLMDLEGAEKAFRTVLELEPENLEARFDLGKVYLQQRRWSEALGSFQRLLEVKPEHFAALYQVGMTHYLQGAYGEALPFLQRAARLNRRSLIARWGLHLACEALEGCADTLEAELRLELAPARAPAPAHYVDVAPALGVDKWDGGMGSAWADYDNDGDLDLFTQGLYGPMALFRNDGAGFVDRAESAGLRGAGGFASLFADYDNDGDADLYITRAGGLGRGPNALYRNEGDGRFAEVAVQAGVADEGNSFTAAWGDVDNDGWLDLVVADGVGHDGSPNRLFQGQGDGRFIERAAAAGIAPGYTIGTALGDYDNDGDLDLYLANFNQLNVLYRNDSDGEGLRFADLSRESRTQLPVGAYWTFFFDYDNDGRLDLFCAELSDYENAIYSLVHGRARLNKQRPALYHNEGDGSFSDRTFRAGLGRSFGTTGAQFGDFDGDGFADIYLANGGAELNRFEPDALWWNRGDGTFAEVGRQMGVYELDKGHGVSFADFDGDGDQDIYVATGGLYPGDSRPNRLFRNDGAAGHWITLRLVGRQSNRDGIGARVRVRAGGRDRYAQVASGGGYGVTNSLQLEVGLGKAAAADEVEIRWPSGRVDQYHHLAAGQVVVLEEGEGEP